MSEVCKAQIVEKNGINGRKSPLSTCCRDICHMPKDRAAAGKRYMTDKIINRLNNNLWKNCGTPADNL